MYGNAVLSLPCSICAFQVLKSSADIGSTAININSTTGHNSVICSAYDTAVHIEYSALNPYSSCRTETSCCAFYSCYFFFVYNLASGFHDKFTASNTHSAHSAVVFQNSTLAKSYSSYIVICGDYTILNYSCILHLFAAYRCMSITLRISLNKVFSFIFSRIIKNDI